MSIDKSIRQHYDVPGTKKIKGQLHKLAYITDKEAKVLKKMGGIETRTPEGILAYPGHHGSSGSSAGVSQGGGGHGGGGEGPRGGHHHPPARPTPVTTAVASPTILAKETKATKPAHLGDTGGSLPTPVPDKGPDHLSHNAPNITPTIIPDDSDGRTQALINISKQKKRPTYIGDEDLEGQQERDQQIALNRLKYDRNITKNEREGLEVGLGLRAPKQSSGFLKGLGTLAAGVFLPMLLPAKAAAAYKMYNTAKTVSKYATKFGLTKDDKMLSLQSKFLNKDMLKQIQKDDIPKVADRHPGTGKKKRTTPTDDRDGVNRILPETLQSTVSEGTQQFLSEDSGNADTITVTITDTDDAVFSLFKTKAVAANATSELLSAPLVVQESEIVKVTAAAANRLHVVLSALEIKKREVTT